MGRLLFDGTRMGDISGVMPIVDRKLAAIGMLRMALRHRIVIAASVICSLLAGAAIVYLQPASFTARAILQLDVAREPAKVTSILGDSPAGPATSLDASTIVQSEAAIMKSPMVVRRAIERLDLPDLRDYIRPNLPTILIGLIENKLYPGAQPEYQSYQVQVDSLSRYIVRNMSIETDSRSYLVNLLVPSNSPAHATQLTNAIAAEYIRLRVDANTDLATKTVDWLSKVVAETTEALRAAESEVADYRVRHGIIGGGTEQDGSSHQQLANLENELNALTLDRINQEGKLAQLHQFESQGVLLSALNLQSLPSVQTLLQRDVAARVTLAERMFQFAPSNPRVQQAQAAVADASSLLKEEVRRAITVMEAGVKIAKQREEELKSRLVDFQKEASSRAEVEAGFRRLRGKEQAIREQLVLLDRNIYRATAVRDLQSAPAAIIMPAEPEKGSPALRIAIIMIAAATFGMIGGVLASLFLERGDHGIRSGTELLGISDVRCLGMIPALPGTSRSRDQKVVRAAMCNEAIRSVGAEIGLFGASRECRIALITSSVAEEATATLCGVLAEVLAAAGKRVMLIGGFISDREARDIETLARNITVEPEQRKGIRTRLERHEYSNLDVFKGEQLLALLETARADFDVILIEAPPVSLKADALVLGHLVDTVVHVARWSETKRRKVLNALQRLKENGIVIDGLVLMNVDLNRHGRLGFVDESFYIGDRHTPYPRISGETASL